MINFLASSAPALRGMLGLFAQQRELPIERLDPTSRATVMVGFAVLLLLLMFLLSFIVLAGRWARRYAQNSPLSRSSVPPDDDWAKKPLVESEANPDTSNIEDNFDNDVDDDNEEQSS